VKRSLPPHSREFSIRERLSLEDVTCVTAALHPAQYL
jgi:hypothetical protein